MGKTITGSSTIGVTLSVNPTTIAGTISTTAYAVFGAAAKAWTLANHGTIRSSDQIGVDLAGGGKVTNAKQGIIGGYEDGILISGNAVISNAGTIAGGDGFNAAAIRVVPDGKLAHITNSVGGLITGSTGINFGPIPGAVGIPGGAVSILNQGVIYGNVNGIYAADGTIDNAKGGTIIGHFGGAVALNGAGTIIDAGLIETTSAFGYAVYMGSSAGNELLLEKGATLIGGILDFSAGQTIDEAGVTITSKSFANGVLTLFDGKSTVGTLDIAGNLNASAFTLKADGHGGTDIVLGIETFTGTYANGVALAAQKDVVASGATISWKYGAAISGSAYRDWTLTNQGTIIGGGADATMAGVSLGGAGLISNAAHGLIEGGIGIEISSGTVVDAGTIIGTAGAAIYLSPGSSGADIILQTGAKLAGGIYGFVAGDTIDLAGVTATGETFQNGILTLTNGKAAVATVALDGLFKTASFELKSISGGTEIIAAPTETFTGHYGVALRLSSPFTSIAATGSFGGAADGVVGKGRAGLTLVNSGTVTGTSDGIYLVGGQVTNAAGGLVSGYIGVLTAGSLTNAGSISGRSGIVLNAIGGVSRNIAGGSIYGSYTSAGLFGGSFANAGAMAGQDFGVELTNGTFSNTGRVIGGGGNYDAYGNVGLYEYRAGGFASNAASGTIEGATGVHIAGGVLVNAGHIIGANNFANSRGLVMTGGVVTNTATGTISGNYGVKLTQGTLIDAGLITATGAAIAFGTLAATLVLDKSNVIDGAISGFIAGDVIDFAGTTIKSETFSGGILTLKDGSTVVEKLSFTGALTTEDFTLVSKGTAGTELILNKSITTNATMQFLRPDASGEADALTLPALTRPITAPSTPAAIPTPSIMGWLQSHPTTPPALVPAVTLSQ
jgi:hypothetical protein